MIRNKFRMFRILLYKDFLVRKRHWKLGLFVEILITLLLFVAIWQIKNAFKLEIKDESNSSHTNETIKINSSNDYFEEWPRYYLLIAPDNQFTQKLKIHLSNCYPGEILTYPTEDDMINDYLTHRNNKFLPYWTITSGLIFKDKNIDLSAKNFKYKLRIKRIIPTTVYSQKDENLFDANFAELQLCIDSSLIKMKKNDPEFRLTINASKMPMLSEETTSSNGIGNIILCVIAVGAFLIPLCIEMSHASSEKFLGVNVLMAMNGVPNYLNLLSWLVTGLILSLFYIVPIIIILMYAETEFDYPFFQHGNSFILWLILTLNIGHLITFGMHFSAYFTRSLFTIISLVVIYVGSIVFMKKMNADSYEVIPYLGIIFPNMLLYRAFEEINFYEDIRKGIHFNNLFQVSDRTYGVEGSLGFMLIFSIIGMILHFLLANYIYAINPGKYGVGKGLFYFLKCFKKSDKIEHCDKIENFEFNDTHGKSFEPVTEGAYSPSIQIRNLKKLYKTSLFSKTRVHALQGVSVDFYKGHITALLGHNGAGKTTMMSILSGMISSSDGLVLVNGKNVKDEMDEIMGDLGLCPQENILFPQLSIAEQVKFFALLKGEGKSLSSIDSEVTQLLSQLKLLDKRNASPCQLSGGQKRRACLAMALVGDPSVLVLDEPTSGLDPESKRDIWNILLKMRGRKTILISTHDMEEADVLGDRIAIMHAGQLKCYGTSLYLKKLLGHGNVEVTLSTEPWCDPEDVLLDLDIESEVISHDQGKLVLSISYNEELPDTLDKIEKRKKELGITGMSVSIITLEKVFLKVTEDNNDPSNDRKPFTDTIQKLKGVQQLIHTWKALLYKKSTYTLKNLSTIIVMLLLFLALLAFTIWLLKDEKISEEVVPIKLDMYHDTENYYKIHQYGKAYAHNYAHLIRDLGGQSQEKAGTSDFNRELLEIGNNDHDKYNYNLFMAAAFQSNEDHSKVNATALYNPTVARFALPMSINLVSNAILRNITDSNHSIEMSVQALPNDGDRTATNTYMMKDLGLFHGYLMAGLFACLIYPAVALFVVHPIRESLTNVKHLQKMSGASCFNYWGTMFIFDLAVFFTISLLFIFGLVIGDWIFDLRMFTLKEVFIQLGLFTLFAINVLPLLYAVSFWRRSTSAAIKLATLLPLALVIVDLTMSIQYYYTSKSYDEGVDEEPPFYFYRWIQKIIFLLMPYVSFFQGQIAFFTASKINAECSKIDDYYDFNATCQSNRNESALEICCNMECDEDSCGDAVPYFIGFNHDNSLDSSFLALGLTSILYFGILLILEYQLFDKFITKYRRSITYNTDATFEEQVRKIKREIAYEVSKLGIEGLDNGKYQSSAENDHEDAAETDSNSSNHLFFVYELRKIYGKFVAVQDISFGVNASECFGLLGVNGAGKSTTFKMMTGELIPNHGVIHLRDKNSQSDKSYLKRIGYCPQNDAIIRSLNAYDHLRLFGRLRGIPEDQLEQEVKNWIDRLNLNRCALQPSGTYSGGNKRRLNIAMALIGIPNLVLLDEPTTAVDPAARRSLWNTIQSCQATGQAVILTSHSMEECEALCNKLAIMVDGKFVCIGPSEELKQRFGAGYDIQMKLSPIKPEGHVNKIKQVMSKALPGEIVDETSGSLLYHVSSSNITWRRMYDVMKDLKQKYTCIEDFSVLSSTLEQLFLMFAKAANRTNHK